VLDHNRRGDWTCPSSVLYPHQWLWDSCFIAMGLARRDPHRAAGELRSLFRGQWSNGMLPHMIFADGRHDVGSKRVWQSWKHPHAPRDVATSCITQPPLPAVAARRVADALAPADRISFLTEVFPKLLDYHQWLYRERDLCRRGLVTLIHPWECGLDTTPPWTRQMANMWEPWWLRLTLALHIARIVRFLRRDTQLVPAGERTSDDDGFRMLILANRAKRRGFELLRMVAQRSVLIEDLAFNALLVVSNRALVQIAHELGSAIDPELERNFGATAAALDELWDEPSGQYYSRDAVTGSLIEIPTIATFLPLWAGVASPAQANRLVARLREPGFWPRFPVPSVPTDAAQFEANRYWKGPTWVNINWAIVQGLRAYGHGDLAEELGARTVGLVDQMGFAEYFSALTGAAFGADDFSWTAALTLDLLS